MIVLSLACVIIDKCFTDNKAATEGEDMATPTVDRDHDEAHGKSLLVI